MMLTVEPATTGQKLTRHLLGIDLGAGSLKATIVTDTGIIAGEANHPIATSVPHFGWSEQDPAEWFAALCAAVPAALKAAGLKADAITGIGISAGAHIPVLTDASGADRAPVPIARLGICPPGPPSLQPHDAL